MPELTARQQLFAEQFAVDCNAAQAAIRAGYSQKAANTVGSFLAKQPHIRAEIDRLLARKRQRTEVTAERVVQELARLAFADARTLHRPDGSLKSPQEWDDDTAAQISGLEVSRTSTRTAASGISARHHLRTASGTHALDPMNPGMDGVRADTEVQVEESTVKVKRYDKVKALDLLARHTGVLGTEGRGQSAGTGIDAMRVARMDDSTLEQALALARQLAALVDA